MAPIMTPFSKYFMINGYTMIMGSDAMMIVAYLIRSISKNLVDNTVSDVAISADWALIKMSRKITWSGYFAFLVKYMMGPKYAFQCPTA